MGVALAVAPLAAEARQGRNGSPRRMVLGCGENACVASTGAPTTVTLLSDITDLTTAASTDPSTDTSAAADTTTEAAPAETTTAATSAVTSGATDPSEPTTPSVPAGTDATQASTTSGATTPSETSAAPTSEATTAPTEPTLPPTPAPEPSVEPTPAPTEPTLPPTPPSTIGTPPLGGSFLMSTGSPKVGVPVTFDVGDLTCDPAAACSYTWQWSFRSASGAILTGGQIGRGETVTYTFDDFAAAKPFVFVTLTVSEGRVGFRRTYTSTFTVTP